MLFHNSYKILYTSSQALFAFRSLRSPKICTLPHLSSYNKLNISLVSSFGIVINRKMSSISEDDPPIKLSASAADLRNPELQKPAQLAIDIFHKAVESVKPCNLMKKTIHVDKDNVLRIDDGNKTTVNLNCFARIFIVGFGKAVLPMAEEVMTILGKRVTRCVVNIPEGFRDSKIKSIEINRGARNNIPDQAAYEGAEKIVQLAKECGPKDLLLVLISGGGSALLPYPKPPITLAEKSTLIKELSRAGASIQELNTVRKRLSIVKGGGLVNVCKSSRIISLILSDVLGDPLDVIASGPTVPNPDPPTLAKEVVKKYLPNYDIPRSIESVLDDTRTPKQDHCKTVTNSIIGNNSIALANAAEAARELNLCPFIITNTLSGDATLAGIELGNAAQAISYLIQGATSQRNLLAYKKSMYLAAERLEISQENMAKAVEAVLDENVKKDYDGFCLLFGGETTVTVKGSGVGGRNQELALNAAIILDTAVNSKHVPWKVSLLSAGTDGFDGPCDAAGAVVTSSTLPRGYLDKLSPYEHLTENNSYNYFKANFDGVYHIITGHTETNVMDVIVIVALK